MFDVQSTVELEPRDRNRKTPLELAAKHGHQDIIKYLEQEKRRRNTFLPIFLDIWTLVFGQSAKSRGPLLFFLGSVLLWAYPMYLLRVSQSHILILTASLPSPLLVCARHLGSPACSALCFPPDQCDYVGQPSHC